MTDESAKLLADALNSLAGALNRLPLSGGMMGGISVYHHGSLSQFGGLSGLNSTPAQYSQGRTNGPQPG